MKHELSGIHFSQFFTDFDRKTRRRGYLGEESLGISPKHRGTIKHANDSGASDYRTKDWHRGALALGCSLVAARAQMVASFDMLLLSVSLSDAEQA